MQDHFDCTCVRDLVVTVIIVIVIMVDFAVITFIILIIVTSGGSGLWKNGRRVERNPCLLDSWSLPPSLSVRQLVMLTNLHLLISGGFFCDLFLTFLLSSRSCSLELRIRPSTPLPPAGRSVALLSP